MKKAVLREYLYSGAREKIEGEIKTLKLLNEIKENPNIKIIDVKRPSIKVSKKKSDK